MAHHKHPPIKRPKIGYFARNEFALVGTTCAIIDGYLNGWLLDYADLVDTLVVTGNHQKAPEAFTIQAAEKNLLCHANWNEYDDKLYGSRHDLVLVNGNHYRAARQIVFVDPNKAGTLERRREQLTDVAAIVLCPGAEEMPAWLKDDLSELPPIWSFDEFKAKLDLLLKYSTYKATPTLQALILTGGKSTRMGEDKGSLVYRDDLSEAERLAEICRAAELPTYFSVSEDAGRDNELVDRFVGLGPLGAIATAFLYDPDAAWLVVACDLPLIDATLIGLLIERRASNALATAVRGASKPFPEPLIAIYEPRAYARMLEFLSIGYACPRKVLINSDVAELIVEDEAPLTNANTPRERERVLAQLNDRHSS